ncbi:lipoyl synthase [bacterium]|nr:lipoyl synthase [bacterium]
MDTKRKPEWLKIRPPAGERYLAIKENLRTLNLHTVCEEASCPNIGECWGGGTATMMVMGDTCTRGCRFCHIKTAKEGLPLDPDEPAKVALQVDVMGLDYVVLTSVDRDDLPDGGAAHFAAVIRAIKERTPKVLVEVLIPDFQGDTKALRTVVESAPDVIAHNVETVRRLTPKVRDRRAQYAQSLKVLADAKRIAPKIVTKTSIMVGLGETDEEIMETLRDLREYDCQIVTFGQYLRPTAKHLEVVDFVTPAKFAEFQQWAEELGFLYVASGPLVRSSYRAGELFIKGMIESQNPKLSQDASASASNDASLQPS